LHNLLEGKVLHLGSAIEIRDVPVKIRQDFQQGLTLEQLCTIAMMTLCIYCILCNIYGHAAEAGFLKRCGV
jgi:hypothetical protein